MADQVVQILVLVVGLEAKLVLQGDRICYNEIEERYFRKQILFPLFNFSFFGVHPDAARKRRRDASEVALRFPALHVSLIGRGASQVEGESTENTQDSGYCRTNADYKNQLKFAWKQ
jgi:hypothetical protein